MACEAIQKHLDHLNGQREALIEEQVTPLTRAAHQAKLHALDAAIATTAASLAACLQAAAPLLVAAPQTILDIVNAVTPDFVTRSKAALRQVLQSVEGKTFPVTVESLLPPRFAIVGSEWIQPLNPHVEYDDEIVGATGWAVHPRLVDGDVPFNHPFQNSIDGTPFDYEFGLALDRPTSNPSHFDFLLSLGNKAPSTHPDPTDERVKDEKFATDLKLNFPLGLLGVEMDGANIPRGFIDNVRGGNRMAVFGRWIVDTGHGLATQSGATVQRTEIHPPLLMAAASNPTADTTRALFTSRPFLVADTFTTDQNSIYDDTAGNDGTFFPHLLKEIGKVNETIPIIGISVGSWQVEAHPKIKSFPFRGVHAMHFLVRPPVLPLSRLGLATEVHHLEVSYRFTVRSGCSVHVTSSAADTIDVFVVMNQAAYKPPPLPHNNGRTWSRDDLAKLNSDTGTDYLGAEILSGALQFLTGNPVGALVVDHILSNGIQTDAYASLNDAVDILSRNGAATNVLATHIPPNTGITVNDGQPFPVYGWLEAKWVSTRFVVQHN